MALTREQAIERLEARRRGDYCEGGQWFDINQSAPGGAVAIASVPDEELAKRIPSCKLCPVLDLAMAGGMDPREAIEALTNVRLTANQTVRRLQPCTGLTLEECKALIEFHDDPESFDREEDRDDYLVPIKWANLE